MTEAEAHPTEQILSVAVPRPLEGLFTYRLPKDLVGQIQVGGWVKVPFGRKLTHAFIVEPPKGMDQIPQGVSVDQLKAVIEVGEHGVIFPEDVMSLCRWTADYYRSPLGEVLNCAAPPAALGLRSTRQKARDWTSEDHVEVKKVALTDEQSAAIETLTTSVQKVALLNGVTGSGKTEVYLELARRVLAQGKGVLILVPEIALTPQLHQRFELGLGADVGLWHSAIADGKRRDLGAALLAGQVKVVVGARSAVFAPVRDLGLIIVDEEHDATFKQEDRVRYQARDLAIVRGKITGARVVLGSATPSLETRERVREGKYAEALLRTRPTGGALPRVEVINLCEEIWSEQSQAPFALKTLEAIRTELVQGNQVMVYLNRRGYASFLVCQDCGEVPGCANCSISLTMHKGKRQLRCHVCGHAEAIPDICVKCTGSELVPMGSGTESVEEDLPKLIEECKVLRLDRDQITSTTRLEKVLSDFREHKANVLLGTQMLVKGHDFPGVTLVVVMLADALFRWPDFRASERALQILTQVSGRAGRGDQPGRVMIQTFRPSHEVIQVMTGEQSETAFFDREREMRQMLGYPPFGRLARVRVEATHLADARSGSLQLARSLEHLVKPAWLDVLGPSEAFLEKAKGIYRWELLLKATDIRALQQALTVVREAKRDKKWSCLVDVDPYGVG